MLGGAALFLLAMGMGVPLLAFGVAAGRGMPTSGPWMVAVQRVFGFVFLGLAVWMLSRILPAPAMLALWGALLLALRLRRAGASSRCAATAHAHGPRRSPRWCWAWSASRNWSARWPAAAIRCSRWPACSARQPARELPFRKIKSVDDLDREIAAAKAAGKPLLFDFYADWCVACKEMEKYTFPQPAVHAALAGFVLLKADVTANDDIDQALMKRFGIIGPPATLFLRRAARERRELRLFGFEEADKFVERAQRVAER